MRWTEDRLSALPRKNGFRLRGAEMTRLETFVDAAFAFAVTMLIISADAIPRSYADLLAALKGIPSFAASFTIIMLYWIGHRSWSRRYGLEDGISSFLSLLLVFVMLAYVYPLRLMYSAFASWLSAGWLPSEFAIERGIELLGLFKIFGLGTAALSGALVLLFLRARALGDELGLNAVERIRTGEEIAAWIVMGTTGLVSALWAWLPRPVSFLAGFIYATLGLTMTIVARRASHRVAALRIEPVERAE